MKKVFLFLLFFVVVGLVVNGEAIDPSPSESRTVAVMINPLPFLIGAIVQTFFIPLEIQYSFSDAIAISLLPTGIYGNILELATMYGGQIGIGPTITIVGKGLEGLYIGAYVWVGWMGVTIAGIYESIEAIFTSTFIYGGNAIGGWKWVFDNGFCLDIGLGVSYTPVEALGFTSIGPTVKAALGYAW